MSSFYESYYFGLIGPGFFNQVPTLLYFSAQGILFHGFRVSALYLKGSSQTAEVMARPESKKRLELGCAFCSVDHSQPSCKGDLAASLGCRV